MPFLTGSGMRKFISIPCQDISPAVIHVIDLQAKQEAPFLRTHFLRLCQVNNFAGFSFHVPV